MQKVVQKQQGLRKLSFDYFILITALLLVCFGVVMVFSASYYTAASNSVLYDNDGLYFFKRQMIGAVAGLFCMIGFSYFPYQKWKQMKYPLLFVAILLLVLVLIPGIGKDVNGSRRWIDLKVFTIQPSEIAKFALIVFMAATVSVNKDRMHTFRGGILPFLCVTGLACIFIYFQPNFSAIVCLCLLAFIMMIVGGANMLQLGVLGGGGLAAGFLVMRSEPYRAARMASFVDPWMDVSGDGYQVIQSLYAIGSGGFFGRGLGNGRQKLLYLPYGESDFIFAIIVEELGLLGAIVLLGLFAFLTYRGIRVAMRAPDLFGSMLATGIVSIIAIQVIINVAVVTSSMPPTGVSMPFISYGSSALIIFMSMIGVLLNISRQSKA